MIAKLSHDITSNIESDILIFADDTSLLATGKTTEITSEILNRDLQKISKWAALWKVNFQGDKSEEIIFSKKRLESKSPLYLNGQLVKRVDTHKHLGLYLTYNLDWSVQCHHVCLKAYRKLAVLRSVKLLRRHTLDVLYKITVRSVLDYSLPVYFNSLNEKQKAKLEKIQYTAAKIVSGALHNTSRVTLNNELAWESINTRAEFLGLTIFHKIVKNETRPLIRECLPPRSTNHVTLRSEGLQNFQFKGLCFSKSFFPMFTKKYNLLNNKTRKMSIEDFKSHLLNTMKPKKCKHFSYGQKSENMLLTRIRVNCSYLKAHSYKTGHSLTTECPFCPNKSESSIHFLIQCPGFLNLRKILFEQIQKNFIPNFPKLSMKRQYEILVFGYEPYNHELKHINGKIMMFTQAFISKTKRFKTKL